MSDNINIQSQSTDPPAEPLTREEQYLSAIAGVTPSSDIPEKPLTRIEKYLNKIVENGGGGGGSFEPTDEQLAAMNSGITEEDVEQINTNKTNILSCKAFTDNASIDSDRKLYISATEPTGDIPIGSTWINGKTVYTYNRSSNDFNKDDYTLSNLYVSTSDNIVYPSESVKSIILSCEPSTTYYVGKTKGNRFNLKTFENVPVQGTLFSGVSVSATGQTEAFITTGANDHYILLFMSYLPDSDTVDDITETIMYTASATAVPYQSYYDWV